MSDRFGLKVKENAGKTKYSSLNLNQTYKGTKVETKTSSGAARHGLQSLGKVGASRRIPPPANLPSLKSENSGNDPTVSLVPSGGGGWGSAKEKPPEGTQGAPQPAPPSSTPQQTNVPSTQQPLLQPQRPVPPPSHPQPPQTQSQNSGQSQTQPVKQQQSQVKTWGSVSSNGAGGSGRTYSQQEMPYFNREFPVLGVGNSGERMPPNMEEKDFAQYGPRPVIRNTHEPAWMERSASGPQPSDYSAARERPEVYNGGPGPGYTGGPHYRRPPDYQHLPHGKSHSLGYPPHHHGNGPHGYGPGPGRPLHGNPPDYATRGPVHKPGAATGPGHPSKLYEGRGEGYGRPAILKPEDIQAMADNDEEEEGGWAGVQDEVDYAAKLDFEDFEEEDKPPAEPGREKSDRDRSNNEVDSRWQSSEGKSVKETGPSVTRTVSSEAQGHPHHYADGRQVPSSPGMQPFDSKGSPPASGWPMPYSKQIPAGQRGGGPPQQAPLDQGKPSSKEEPVVNEWQKRREKQQEEMRAAVERARKRREEEELKRQLEQKAASHAKLKELEQKRARRESGKEGDDAWAEELDFIEKDVHIKEPVTDEMGAESLERVQEPQNTAVDQHDNAMLRTDNSERLNRVRNDSDSSDASRSSSSRGTSRPHHHPRDIPPRFQQQQQQQQLRQQQQQHIQSNYYHQQQPYPHQYQTHHQQLSRSSHQREFQEGPLSVSSHPVVDSGPVSPSQPVKPDLPVKRIMKRSDSSSTAGDDISSVKSLESATGEPAREIEKRSSAATEQQTIENTEVIGEQTKEQSFEAVNLKGKTQDDLDLPVFEEDGIVDSRDERQQQQQEAEKPRVSESEKERVISKEKLPEKKERKESREAARKPPPEKMPQIKDRREDRREDRRDDRRGTKRDTRPYERRRNDDSKDLGKRKRDDNDEGGYVPERRGRFAGRDDSKRDRFSEFRGRGRVSFPVRGLGRGMGASATSYRGRGRGERGVRDYREPKPFRSREPKPLSPAKSLDGEQKPAQEDKENVAAKENSSIPENDATEKEEKIVVVVKQLDIEDGLLRPEKELVTGKEDEGVDKEKKDVILKQENKEGESKDSTSRLADNDADTVSRQDPRKRQDNNRETDNLKPKGRGGFGKPSQYSDDSRRISYDDKRPSGKTFPDRRRPYNDKGRDRGEDHENKRFSRNYNKDQTSQRSAGRENRNKDRGREKEQKVYSNYDRDAVNRRYSQDDRKKRLGEKDDEQQYSRPRGDERNQRGGYRSSYSTRGRFSKPPVRPSTRGGRSSQPVASGQFGNNYRRSKSTDEELSEDDYESDSSSYTTATSASEERRDDKTSDKETDPKKGRESSSGFAKKTMPSSRSARSPLRGKVASRAGPRGTGGFGRSRREVERPPRFQKQQERERASFTRGVSRGDRHNEGGENRPGRGRGRGRGRKDQLPLNSSVIPVTEDWDQEVGSSVKEEESSRNEKLETRKESISRKGFSSSRPFSDRTRKDKGRESGGAPNTSSRREPFLVERQQAKVEGSKFTGGEPRVPLPAARNGFSKDGNRRSDVQSGPHSTGLDSINTGSSESSKVGRQQDPTSRKTDIQQFDLHNIAGVICIDDMTDDDSDISSTLSGFVEVTSRRTQKENKERQREEEERRKKTDEQIRQRSNQTGNKKGQSTKPPRFSKQHSPQVNTQSKAVGVIGKSVHGALSEAVAGLANTTSNSNASSASSTKRNSPITVERPVSPAPPPVFNAWDKPLNIVTPAKPPSASPQVITTVPDPLAVGSGKPSSTRSAQSGTVMPTVPPSLIEDASVEEDYIAMTKEIALLAPPEEPDESEEPSQTVNSTKPKVGIADQTSEVSKDASEKRTQSKPQREKPPRFDRISKRKVAAANSEETKKETYAGGKGRKSSCENLGPQNQQAKASADNNPKRKNQTQSSTQQPPSAAEDEIPDGLKSTQDVLESKDHDVSARATASDEGSDEKDALKESEGQEGKDDSESESSRKDSEPDLNVDSSERNSDGDNLFTASSLTVDIHERSTGERPAREPSPVSPAIFEMSMKMEASRKLWENGLEIRRPGNPVTAWEETLRTPSVSSSIVGMPVVESPDLRLSDDQVAVSKPQADIDVNPSKPDSKSTDGMNFNKKPGTGEQQNVCKVKPQQQQQPSVKPQQSNPVVAQTPEESRPNELNTVPLTQPLLTQEQLLAHQAMPQRYAFPFVSQLMDLQQRQPFLRQPQIQQLQEANQQVTPTFPITHVQEVNQTRASSSPLSQAAQDIYQSSFLASGVYSAGTFQGAQPFVSIALLPSTTTQSYATSTPTTQTASLIGMHTQQQAKTASGAVFPQNVNPQGGQTMYVPFDPKSLSGGTPLFNLTQHPPSAQRHLLGGQPGLVGDNVPRQGGFPTPPPGHQPFQGTYSFHQKQAAYDVSQDMQINQKSPEQTAFNRQSELVKHVNAKPFEPPKRSTPGTGSSGSAPIGPLVSSAFTRNPNMMAIRPSPPDAGGPSQSPPVSTSILSGRPVSVSPVDPGVPFPGAVGTFPKHPAISQFQVQQQPQGVQPQQFTPFQQQAVGIQHALQIRPQGQQQQQTVNSLPGATAAILPNPAVLAATIPRQLVRAPGLGAIGLGGPQPSPNAQRFPAPIQRPMAASLMHGMHHMQAPRGPRPQSAPPQMIPAKQQAPSSRPQMLQGALPPQDPMAAAFKYEQHHKMMEQTRMFFAQQGHQQQHRVPQQNISDEQQLKAVTSLQGDKANVKAPALRETNKLQDKKDEVTSRNKKPSSEQANKTSKTTKVDSKPDESNKDKNSKQDGKIAVAKSVGSGSTGSGVVRIQPLHMHSRSKPNRPRGPPRMPGMPPNKAKLSGRPEKEVKDASTSEHPGESQSPRNSDQAKASDVQSVSPLGVNQG